jgi:hypothetical protein
MQGMVARAETRCPPAPLGKASPQTPQTAGLEPEIVEAGGRRRVREAETRLSA